MESILPLFIIAIPVASIAWTVTHEEAFREFHEYCANRSRRASSLFEKKFFYLFTCEYCFSHYVALFMLVITDFTIYFSDWRGYLISFFSIVFIANIYMSLFGKIRVEIKKEREEIKNLEKD